MQHLRCLLLRDVRRARVRFGVHTLRCHSNFYGFFVRHLNPCRLKFFIASQKTTSYGRVHRLIGFACQSNNLNGNYCSGDADRFLQAEGNVTTFSRASHGFCEWSLKVLLIGVRMSVPETEDL